MLKCFPASWVWIKRTLAITFCASCSVILLILLVHRHHFFGPGTLTGGTLGRTFDNSVRTVLWRLNQRRVRLQFQSELGYAVPATQEATNLVGVPVLTEAYLRETVLRAWRRHLQYQKATKRSSLIDHIKACASPPIVQPLVGDWYQPRHTLQNVLWVDISTMDSFMNQYYASITPIYQRLELSQRSQLWALCHIALFGGIFVGPKRQSTEHDNSGGSDCFTSLRIETDSRGNLDYLQAPPKHPGMLCIVRVLSQHAAEVHSFRWKDVVSWMASVSSRWGPANASVLNDHSCLETDIQRFFVDETGTVDMAVDSGQKESAAPTHERWLVEIREPRKESAMLTQPKEPWIQRLVEKACSPGWTCHRCLRLPWLGSHKACARWFCPACYQFHFCRGEGDDSEPNKQLYLDVEVEEVSNSTAKRIPPIIHQTWFEELTTVEYPHLQRLQNSWKAAKGWEYRFYTDESAREFIGQHFPSLFVDVYDAIVVPAFKADFFRLAVLAIHGGVYSDVDVMLEINLDFFITSNLSFFVPRDVNVDMWPSSNYCVWNGLIGSSPGHPIVIKALEDLVNRVLQREDYLDIESSLCRRNLSAEVWKLRCSPMLLVTGPCALGVSLSDSLGRDDPLMGWELGWQETSRLALAHEPSDHDWGDVMLLLLDRYDLGEQRFTDVDRNLLVASTNQDRIATRAVHDSSSEHKHYSSYESDVVGSRAYRDDKVVREQVRLRIKHRYV